MSVPGDSAPLKHWPGSTTRNTGLSLRAFLSPRRKPQGLIIPLGDEISNQVFRFVSEHDLDALGLRFVEMNLSVAQCMDSSLPAKLSALQKKYGVDPGTINLEITETTYENIGEIMLENISALIKMGYSFALDDYGTGYSSIQRINRLPPAPWSRSIRVCWTRYQPKTDERSLNTRCA
jgi:FOG: EAL domain